MREGFPRRGHPWEADRRVPRWAARRQATSDPIASRAAAAAGGGDSNRNFGPNKPPKGRGGSNFSKSRNQEGKARGPLKERLSGRMFSVDEDSRFRDEDDTGVDEVELLAKDEDVKEDIKEDIKEDVKDEE